MNNAWTTVAFRASCAATRKHARSPPLLQLFNGFARSYQTEQRSGFNVLKKQTQHQHLLHQTCIQAGRRSFSNSAILSAKPKGKSLKKSPESTSNIASNSSEPSSDPKISPAPAVAYHTEGIPPKDEVSGIEQSDVLTWRDYDPDGGMPLPVGELGQDDIGRIFEGEKVDVETGNYILSVMHWRRMSGALIDVGLEFPKDSLVSEEQAFKGLSYIRTLIPNVDEQANGQVWAHEESHRLQEQIQQRAIKLGIYKTDDKNNPPEEEEEPDHEKQGTEYGRERTGQSILETVRLTNEARYERELAEQESAQARAEISALHSLRGPLELSAGVQPSTLHLTHTPSGGISLTPPKSSAWLTPAERKPWVKYFEEQAQIIKSQSVPALTLLQRLGPSFLALVLVLAAALYAGENYTPPPKSARILPDVAPSVATLYALTGVLVATFVLGRIPPLWRTYSKYLTLVPAYPYVLSLVGAGLRHDSPFHLASNLVTLWLFGLLLHEDVGRGNFLAIYFASGAVGGFASLAYNVLRKQWLTYIFGSSGCVLGIVAATCTLRPNGTVQVMGYDLPVAAWVFLALFGGLEAVAAVRGVKTRIDHAGHLGGMVGGVAWGMFLRGKAGLGKGDGGGHGQMAEISWKRDGVKVEEV